MHNRVLYLPPFAWRTSYQTSSGLLFSDMHDLAHAVQTVCAYPESPTAVHLTMNRHMFTLTAILVSLMGVL